MSSRPAQSRKLNGTVVAVPTVIGGLFAIAATAIVNLRPKLAKAPDGRSATERAIARASGIWGGYQAAPPRP